VLVPSPLRLKIRGEIRGIFGAKRERGLRRRKMGRQVMGLSVVRGGGERVDRMSEGRNGK